MLPTKIIYKFIVKVNATEIAVTTTALYAATVSFVLALPAMQSAITAIMSAR